MKILHNIALLFNKKVLTFLILWIVSLSVLYATLSIVRHSTFQSGGFDLGIYDQAVWQYSRLEYPYNTIKERFILGDHLTLTLPLLAPLFWIWDDVRMLLLFQAIWVSVASLPLFFLIKKRGFSSIAAFSLTILYSLFYGIQFLVFFDFHPVALAVGLIPWLLYFLETGRKRILILSVILLLLTQENMGIALASLGFVYSFQKQFRRTGLLFVGLGIIASVVAALLIKTISPVGFEYTPQIERNPWGLFAEFFDKEEKQTVWLYSLGWFSFLPLLSPGAMLGMFLDLAQYFVTGDALSRMWSPFTHHRVILAPILLLGSLDGMRLLEKLSLSLPKGSQFVSFTQLVTKPEIVSGVMVVVALLLQFQFHFPLNKLSKSVYYQQEEWMEDNRQLFRFIPKNASVAASQNLVPHLSHRKEIYLVYPREHEIEGDPCGRKLCWWLDFGGKPEYLVVDVHSNQWLTQLLETNDHFQEAVNNMETKKKLRLVKHINEARLYEIVY